jgi:capsular polysaccharide biosynthesis protein
MSLPVRWLPSRQAAEQGLGRWREVYAATPNARRPHSCHGATQIDLRNLIDPVFPEAGVLELERPLLLGIDGWVFSEDGCLLPDHSWYGRNVHEMKLPAKVPAGVRVPGVCMSLGSDFASKNVGHFVHDSLTRLHLFAEAGIRVEDVDHVFCPAPPTPLARQLFERLEIPASKCIWLDSTTAVTPDTLYVATLPGTRRNYPRWVPEFVKRTFPAVASSPTRRLFLSRAGYRRTAVNEAAIRRILVDAGFEIYDPAKQEDPFRDFAEAALVVGAHGAAMIHLAWCPPKTRVLELLPSDHIQPYHYTLADAAGLDYHCLVCRSERERRSGAIGPSPYNFHVDEDELSAAVAIITAA